MKVKNERFAASTQILCNFQELKYINRVLDWRKGEFAWIKFTERSKHLPGFILPVYKGMNLAQSITLKGTLSIGKFIYFRQSNQIHERLKNIRYRRALKTFNNTNACNYE